MITFATVFLGLIVGLYPVELTVAGPVATVDVQLDGELVATLERAPWWFDCDFGPRLEPHELVAIARDENGNELGRVQ